MKKLFAALIAAFALVAFLPADSHAVSYAFGSNNVSIPGLTGFATTGSDMDGLAVTALFSTGASETVLWADTGIGSGGVFGTGWSLTLSGDTFTAPWEFDFAAGSQLELVQLTLDGLNALTVFDISLGGVEGTPGSALGADWTCLGGDCEDVLVTYDYQVAIGGNPAVGDLWQIVTIDWREGDFTDGVRSDFSFGQDTDNDARAVTTPEPGVLTLLGLGLLATRLLRRRND